MLVLDDTRIIAIWYTLDPDGNLIWIYGDGTVQPPATPETLDVTVQFDAFVSDGPQANPMTLEHRTDLTDWGTWTMLFSACEQARFSWQANAASWPDGEIEITQLTGTSGQDCSARSQ